MSQTQAAGREGIVAAWMRPRPLPPALATAALLIYIVACAFVAAHHEQWRDEADAWLVARDAGPHAFLERASLGGTPELWHLMLVPLAKSGAPYWSQQVLHLCIATATAAILLFIAPLPPLTRIAAVFSYFFAYEYAIVVRSYAASVLLLLIVAALHRKRLDNPWRYAAVVALLANTNSHSLIIAAFIGMLYLDAVVRNRELPRLWKPLALMIAGGVGAGLQMTVMAGERATTFVHIQPGAPFRAIGEAFLPMPAMSVAPFIGLIVLAAATWSLRHEARVLLFLWTSYAALMAVFTFWWLGGLRHSGFILVLLICALWMARAGEERAARGRAIAFALLTATLLYADLITLYSWIVDTRYAFSGSREVAEFIERSGLSDRVIAAHSETTGSAIAPYLRHPLWYPGIEEFGTFVRWDRKFDSGLDTPYPVAVRRFRQRFGRTDALLILNVAIPNPAAEGLRLVYRTRSLVHGHPDEQYWLYESAR